MRRLGLRSVETDSEQTAMLWDCASAAVRARIQATLLEALKKEAIHSVRKKICDTIAEVAKMSKYYDTMSNTPTWPELLPAMFECTKAPSHIYRESAFLIFAAVPEVFSSPAEGGNLSIQPQYIPVLKDVFAHALQDEFIEVRLASLKACVTFLNWGELDNKLRTQLASEIMNYMANVLVSLHSSKPLQEDWLVDALTSFIELCENYPKLVRHILPTLLSFLVEIIKDKNLEDRTRQSALELAVSIGENAPGMCRKIEGASFSSVIVPSCLAMMTEMEDDLSWYNTSPDDYDDAEDNCIAGEQALDRLARSIGGKNLLPPVFAVLPGFLGSTEWSQRHAALMCISSIAEGCVKIMEPELGRVVDMVLPHIRDPHPRVRFAACHCLGQMCTDFAPTLQDQFHRPVVESLCIAMDYADQPRVQAHGAAALVNFCESASPASIIPYVGIILERLTKLIQTPIIYVQEQAMTTLATLADASATSFSQYYPSIMPVLLQILQQASAKEYRMLRGKTLECSTLMALAVGKEHFFPHAQQLVSLMTQIQAAATDADDPQTAYLLAGWARLCKVLGQDFVQYLPIVMPQLLESASHKPDVAVLESDEDAEARGYSEEDGWEFVMVDDQKLGIKTTMLEEKCTAVEMLTCYARELGPGFRPHAEKVLKIVIPLFKFYFHEGIRHAAAMVVPFLFASMKVEPVTEELRVMWTQTLSSIVEVIHDEPDAETLGDVPLGSVTFHPFLGGKQELFSEPILKLFAVAIVSQISEVFARVERRQRQRMDSELYDPELEETLQEEEGIEDSILGELSRAVHIVFKTQGQNFLPFFQQGLLSVVNGMLHAKAESTMKIDAKTDLSVQPISNQARQWAVCVFDDLIEFCGPAVASEYRTHFWDAVCDLLLDGSSPDVRQACAYGMGTLAMKLGELPISSPVFDAWIASLSQVTLILFESLSTDWSKNPHHAAANENVVSAIGKILHYVVGPLRLNGKVTEAQFNDAVAKWISFLPILEDEEEAPHTYGFLIELIEQRNPAVMADLTNIVRILLECIGSQLLSKATITIPGYGSGREVEARALFTVKSMWLQCPDEAKSRIIATLQYPIPQSLFN